MNNYTRGSEWRKWDLHVHSPASDGFSGTWDQFETQVSNADCLVIGINDYFSVAGYKYIKEKIAQGSLNINGKKILPVVEFRMTESIQNKNTTTNGVAHFNFHIIFDDSINIADIENMIKSLKSNGTLISSDYDDKLKLKDKKISFDSLLTNLSQDKKFEDKFLVWLPYDEYGGIDEIDPISDEWIKNYYIRKADIIGSSRQRQIDFFHWKSDLKKDGTSKFTQKQFQDWFQDKKACIKGSDSHSIDYPIGKLKDKYSIPINKYCWIKADPTFEGLKQAVYEPEDRIFIGEEPELLKRVKNNGTRYIKSVSISISTNKDQDSSDQIWFRDLHIPISKELTAIIGNKGSGKSAITDIIALCADAKHQDDFQFLNKHKFKKSGFAERFYGLLEFESDYKTEERKLDYNIKEADEPKVQYLPQNYFEKVCNEIGKAESFRTEIEKVVFQYIKVEDRLNTKTFKELIAIKTSSVETEISALIAKINNLNKEIIKLEDKNNPLYKENIESKLKQKNEELKAHEANKPQNPKKTIEPNKETSANNIDSNQAAKLKILEDRLKGVEDIIATLEKELSANNLSIQELSQLKRDINSFKNTYDEFKKTKNDVCSKFKLNISELISITYDISKIEKNIQTLGETNNAINERLGTDEPVDLSEKKKLSLRAEKKKYEDEISLIIKTLSQDEQAIQKYQSETKQWEEKRAMLNGTADAPNSIEFYKNEINFIKNGLCSILEKYRNERVKYSLEIYSKKAEIKKFYDEIKTAISLQLSNCEIHDLSIVSSLNINSDFFDVFLNNVLQNKAGSFYGKEDGVKFLKDIILQPIDWNDSDAIASYLNSIITAFEIDKRSKENQSKENQCLKFIGDQIKNREDFYEYIFSLKYLEPVYELQKDGKNIESLSPGEKGALLLVFYLVLDQSTIPLIIDQPEDNLDNNSVFKILVPFIRKAKKRRQIIMVTHNPNLAVVADAEQVIRVNIDKKEGNRFSYISGSIENPKINHAIVDVLEGTMPAFNTRKRKYHNN